MNKRLLSIFCMVFIVGTQFVTIYADQVSDTVSLIQASQGYDELKTIISQYASLIKAATDDAYTVKSYVKMFYKQPFKATKNIIQRAGRLLGNKKKLDNLLGKLALAVTHLTDEIITDQKHTKQVLRKIAYNLVRLSRFFKDLGHLRAVHRLGKNVSQMVILLESSKGLVESDPVLLVVLDQFPLEKEIYQLNEDLKGIKRRTMKIVSKNSR